MREERKRSGNWKAVCLWGLALVSVCGMKLHLQASGNVPAGETVPTVGAGLIEAAPEAGTSPLTDTVLETGTAMAAGAAPEAGMRLGAVAVGEIQAQGDELQVFVAVQALPGAAEIDHINLQFQNPENDRSVTKILRKKDFSEGVYSGWLKLSVYEPAGNYVLDRVILQDQSGAYVRYRRADDVEENDGYLPLPVTAAFAVNTGISYVDEEAPVLGAVSVAPAQASPKAQIIVAAEVADDFSGVDSVSVRFENEAGKTVSVELKPEGDLYTGRLSKTQTEQKGIYRIKRVTVTDRMGNSRVYRGGDGPFASGVCFEIR